MRRALIALLLLLPGPLPAQARWDPQDGALFDAKVRWGVKERLDTLPFNEALVRVHAISLNRGECNRAQNSPAGALLGWDIAGVIEQPVTSEEYRSRLQRVLTAVVARLRSGDAPA